MCGIFGVIDSKAVDKELFNESLDRIKHRGPDNQTSISISPNVMFGHVRLSIIDLNNNNNQPFVHEDRYYLTYNGEIFNYIELKQELISLGYEFKTSGDTEVLIKSYVEWGDDCVNKLNGMWAFAIYDCKEEKLFCSRDRFGIKPFYYFQDNSKIIFSSEIKAIINYYKDLIKPDLNVIYNFLYNNLGAESNMTWFKDINRLLPSHNICFKKNNLEIKKYWDYKTDVNEELSFKDAKEQFKIKFDDAVKLRLRSDVEIASTLSSGLDSNIVTSVLDENSQNIFNTFTLYSKQSDFSENEKIYYNKETNLDESIIVRKELDYYNMNTNFIALNTNSFLLDLKKCIYHLESGHSSTAIVSAYNIYKEVSEKNIKVILEGQGADELLGGYLTDTIFLTIYNYFKNFNIKKALIFIFRVKNHFPLKEIVKLSLNLLSSIKIFNLIKRIILNHDISKNSFNGSLITSNVSHTNYFVKSHKKGLVNLLSYADALSMSCAVESRLPFMDYRFVNYSFSLPYRFKINGLKAKYILRETYKNQIPKSIYASTLKLGFVTPIDKILKKNKIIKKILYSNSNLGVISNHKKNELLDRYYKNKFKSAEFIYKILTLLIWEDIFLKKNNYLKK